MSCGAQELGDQLGGLYMGSDKNYKQLEILDKDLPKAVFTLIVSQKLSSKPCFYTFAPCWVNHWTLFSPQFHPDVK